MEFNHMLKDQIFEVVDNQLKSNEPPETKTTFERLKKEGYTDLETRQLIGQCVMVELYDVINTGQPFNEQRYVDNLKKLPQEPESEFDNQ